MLWVAARHVPESRNPAAARQIDVAGVLTGAIGLGGLTYGFTAWPAHGPGSPQVLIALAVGVAGLVAFVLSERRSAHPMLPLDIFGSKAFTGANLVTFLVYAANGGVFFLVVLNLQVVAGFSPLVSGIAMLPVTVLMLLLSARAGALGQRIGPRIPMTVGPVICAVGPGPDVAGSDRTRRTGRTSCPPVIVFGLGLCAAGRSADRDRPGRAGRHRTRASPAASTTRWPGPPACCRWRSCRWPPAWAAGT